MNRSHSLLIGLIVLSVVSVVGCNGSAHSDVNYVERRIGGITIRVQPHTLDQSEQTGLASQDQTRNLRSSSNSESAICFRVSFAHSDENSRSNDAITAGLSGYDEYANRIETLFFDLPEYLTLVDGATKHQAMGAIPDQDFGMKGERQVLVVFPVRPSDLTAKTIDIVFNDQLFGTGISHYSFSREELLDERRP